LAHLGRGAPIVSQMSDFKRPKAVAFGPIPRTSTGKFQKFMLRDEVKSAKAISK
jgi:fatty-acyl-CoA synthase